ncbi:smr domain-containing protein [Sphaerosporella brunnea]|uniref:Smr domain-containing protein n=1 Tax=Sphaerosporella brunnea TaxID=1250544 RepID=A0A5J5EXV6_9PEZI|nr:smr domain-containing protein [Sphaerosporella brunnea]
MSYPMTELNTRALNRHTNGDGDGGGDTETEREYDRLRELARTEGAKRSSCLQRSQAAYQSGDKAAAHQLSQQGKAHARQMEAYNRQARDFIFRANNADQAEDTIDLHGLYVEEAGEILEQRIKAATARGDEGLHVIVGRGNHSQGGVRKLAPAVESVCGELGLRFRQEENAGRIYVWLRPGTGGDHVLPPGWDGHGGQQQQQLSAGYPQQHHGQQQQQPDVVGEAVAKVSHSFFKKLGECCVIM